MSDEIRFSGKRRLDFDRMTEPQKKTARNVMEPNYTAKKIEGSRLDSDINELAMSKFHEVSDLFRLKVISSLKVPQNNSNSSEGNPGPKKIEKKEGNSEKFSQIFFVYQDGFYGKLVSKRIEALEEQIKIERMDKKRRNIWQQAKQRLSEHLESTKLKNEQKIE